MKFMIAVDCDGVACVVGDPGQALSYSRDYWYSRTQATRETDAAARALFDAGADHVTVWDNHGCGSNLDYHLLDRRCDIALGAGFPRRWPGLDASYAGVLMIGYHAMEGTPEAVLSHTYSPGAYHWIAANGRRVGEIALDAAVAGDLGVPLIFLSSDDKGCAEAARFAPWTRTVRTKVSAGQHCAFSLHPARAVEEVYDSVRKAVTDLAAMQPLQFDRPLRLEIRFCRPHQALKARILRGNGWRLAGLRTLRLDCEDMQHWSG